MVLERKVFPGSLLLARFAIPKPALRYGLRLPPGIDRETGRALSRR